MALCTWNRWVRQLSRRVGLKPRLRLLNAYVLSERWDGLSVISLGVPYAFFWCHRATNLL